MSEEVAMQEITLREQLLRIYHKGDFPASQQADPKVIARQKAQQVIVIEPTALSNVRRDRAEACRFTGSIYTKERLMPYHAQLETVKKILPVDLAQRASVIESVGQVALEVGHSGKTHETMTQIIEAIKSKQTGADRVKDEDRAIKKEKQNHPSQDNDGHDNFMDRSY